MTDPAVIGHSNRPPNIVADVVAMHRALAVLRILIDDSVNGRTNERVISDALDTLGLGCSLTTLQASIRHLEQSGLITTSSAGDLLVLRVTREGQEVATGKQKADGVLPFSADCSY